MISLGIIGTGRIALEHVRAIHAFNSQKRQINVIGVVGRNSDKTASFAKEIGVEPFFSVEKLLSSNLDGIIVAVNETSVSNLINQLKDFRGGIFIEKPLGYDLSSAEKINDDIVKYNLDVYVLFNRRFYKNIQEARMRFQRKKCIVYAQVAYLKQQFIDYGYDVEVISNIQFSYHIHLLDALNFVYGSLPNSIEPLIKENNLIIHSMHYDNATVIFSSVSELRSRWCLEIYSQEEYVTFKNIEHAAFHSSDGSLFEISSKDECKPGFLPQIAEIYHHLVNKNSSLCDYKESMRLMYQINHMYRS